MKALVTGGAGFIGSSLCEALVAAGWEVRAFDNLTVGSKKNIRGLLHRSGKSRFEIVAGDCTRLGQIRKAVRDCDILFHLAANPEVRMELNNPEQCYRQNVYTTYCVLEALRTSKASTIVFASTSTIYGRAKTFPTPEEYAPLEPISLYGASKLAGEAMNKIALMLLQGKTVENGANLGLPGYEKVTVSKGPGKGIIVRGQGWVSVDKSNYKQYSF